MEHEKSLHGSELTMRLSGRCNFASLYVFENLMDEIRKSALTTVTLDLSALQHIDSSGLGILLMLQEVCQEHKANLVLYRPHSYIQRILDATHLSTVLTIRRA